MHHVQTHGAIVAAAALRSPRKRILLNTPQRITAGGMPWPRTDCISQPVFAAQSEARRIRDGG